MKVLLDTHVWIWRLMEPERLSPQLSRLLSDPARPHCLSPISVWEALILARKGRLRLEPDPLSWVRQALSISKAAMAPLTHEIALRSEDLPGFPSSDPADRFLVATALVENLTLATADSAMRGFPGLKSVG